MNLQVGVTVEWSSQAGGWTRAKAGSIHAIVPPDQDAFKFIPEGVARSRIKFDTRYANEPRYIVAVVRGNAHDFYCPRTSQLRLILK